MSQNFSYKTLGAKELLESLCHAYQKKPEKNKVILSEGKYPDYTQYLLLPTDIEVLLSEYVYHENTEIWHYAEQEAGRDGDMALWLDLAENTSQHYSLVDQTKAYENTIQHRCVLLNSAYTYSVARNAGCFGKSLLIFLPAKLMTSLFNKEYLNTVVENYYAMQCRGLQLEEVSAAEVHKVLSVFHQWNQNKNLVSITKSVHQLVEWFFTKLFKKFDGSDEMFKLSTDEKKDLINVEAALVTQMSLAAPDMDLIKKIIQLPFAQVEEKFKNIYGETIHQYFKTIKFRQGKIYLQQGKSVADTAYELGYANPSNFSASFKKIYNSTPEDYRKQIIEV